MGKYNKEIKIKKATAADRIKHASVQPLTGGMSIGFSQVLGCAPEFIVSSSFGASNTQEVINYYNDTLGLDVPVIEMTPDYTEFLTPKDEELFNQLNKDIEIIDYLPICSGLSTLTSGGCKDKCDNKQNDNQYELSRFIFEKINPKIASYENAPQLYTKTGEGVLENVRKIGEEHNYSLTVEATDTFLHGVPQHRQRTFCYFFRDDDNPGASLIEYEELDTPGLTEYLADISKGLGGESEFADHEKAHKDITYQFLETLCEGTDEPADWLHKKRPESFKRMSGFGILHHFDLWDKAIPWVQQRATDAQAIEEKEDTLNISNSKYSYLGKQYWSVHRNYIRMEKKIKEENKGYWDDSCVFLPEIPTSVNAVTWKLMRQQKHPVEDRAINLREYASLMALPEKYNLADWDKDWVKISQSVPVCTARHVADNCKKYVQGDLIKSHSIFVKQSNKKQRIDVGKQASAIDEW